MNKTCLAMLIAVLAMVSFACAMPVTMDRVEVNGARLDPSSVNKLDLENGQEISVKVELTSQGDFYDVEVKAFITGYEYNDRERISDTTHSFDMEENTTYSKRLKLTLPDRIDEDEYKLRIIVSDRNNDEASFNYNLKIEPQRHYLNIRDILVSPENGVEAGRYVLASVRVKNIGQKDEDSVKVSFAIPDLGISQSAYMDEIEAGDTESSEEVFMVIPECAESGEYTMLVTLTYDEGYEQVRDYATVVVNGDSCEEDAEEEEEAKEEDEEDDFVMPPAQQQQQPVDEGQRKLRTALEISLVALIIILVILGLVIGFSKLNSDEEMY